MVFKKILYFLFVCAILIVYLTHSREKYIKELPIDKYKNYVKRDIGLFENSIVTTTITTDTTKHRTINPVHINEYLNIVLIFPFRNRHVHYNKLMLHLKNIKKSHWNIYTILVEQANDKPFERSWLMNVGIAEARKRFSDNSTCIVTHDVDMLPAENIDYGWCDRPTQICSELSCFNGNVAYDTYSGGVVQASMAHWYKINGFTNKAKGWGGEDDDLYHRFRINDLLHSNKALRRPSKGYGKCHCMNDKDHTKRKKDNNSYKSIVEQIKRMEKGSNEWKTDGLNSLKYYIISEHKDKHDTLYLKVQSDSVKSTEIKLFKKFEGRLGNQMFQWISSMGISNSNKMTLCIITHSKLLEEIFINSPSKCDITPNLKINKIKENGYATYNKFNFYKNTFLTGYLQSYKYFPENLYEILKIKQNILKNAQNQLLYGKTNIGIHVRRFELNYMRFPSDEYFKNVMNKFRKEFSNAFFYVVSDGINWCKRQEFFQSNDVKIIENDPALDMVFLTTCDHVILTVGTFGWWSAFLGAHKKGGRVIYNSQEFVMNHPTNKNNVVKDDYYPNEWLTEIEYLKYEQYSSVVRKIGENSNPNFKIHILTMTRYKSLKRLLNSLENSFYNNDKVELHIHVDKSKENDKCIEVIRLFEFSYGKIFLHISPVRNGLRNAWLKAWDVKKNERAIIFEDDIEVSPYWYLWLKAAWDKYKDRMDLAGISLQRQTLIPKKPPTYDKEIINNNKPFLYKLVGSIGFSPHPIQWNKFLMWTKTKNLDTYNAKVDGLITSDWYVTSNKKSIWTQLFIKYCVIEDLYTLYINLPEKKTLATHWKEKGEHFRGNEGKDFELSQKIKLEFPTNLVKYDFDGKPIVYKITDKSADEIKYDWKIILEKACDNQKNVFITISVGGLGISLTNNLLRSYSRIVVFIPPPNEITNTPNSNFLIHTKYLSSLKESKWGEKSHLSINAAKALVIHNILLLGFSVTYIDSDSVLLRYPKFLTSPMRCDIYHSIEKGPMCSKSTSNACAGFLHFKNNKMTQRFTKTWSSVSQKDLTTNDQCHFQRLVTKNNNNELKICSLPKNEYANGWTWVSSACKNCINLDLLKQTATVVHANYLIGNSVKINTLKKAGFFES